MDIFYQPHRELMQQLLNFKVEFLLIGGYAVNYHGFNRPTGDLDLWLKPTVENKDRLLNMLQKLDFEEESIDYIKSIDFNEVKVFCMGQPPVRVDFLTKVSGVDYIEADSEKIIADVDDMKIPIINLRHLLLSKMSNDRTKDKLDVEELQKIQRNKEGA